MWKRRIPKGQKVGLELTRDERRLLLTGIVFLHLNVEAALHSTPPGEALMLTLGDLDDLAGHVAGEANHARTRRIEATLDAIHEKIEELLELHVEETGAAGTTERREPVPGPSEVIRPDHRSIVIPMPRRPGWADERHPIRMTAHQRESLLRHTGLGEALRDRIGRAPEGTQDIEFSREELDEVYGEVGSAILRAPSPHKKRLMAVQSRVAAVFERENLEAFGIVQPKRRAEPVRKAGIVYQLKVMLKYIRPPIWRRLLVPDCSLAELHEVIQVAMGWENYHLYSFEAGGVEYSDERGGGEVDMEDADGTTLGRVAGKEKAKFRYTYDFGDNWQHEVLVETLLPPEEGQAYPLCLKGKRACPPEDVGGPWGYMEFAEAITDPEHEQHEEFLQWRGEFDPEAFDLDAVNEDLRRLRPDPTPTEEIP